jgi:two-component system, OmpR family, KDP operon response regulator KdpE
MWDTVNPDYGCQNRDSIVKERKILGVDDEPRIRKLLQIGLKGYGYDVITAANGQEALTLAAQQAPDVIVLDINLGSDPDGVEVCRSLREWSKTPVIALSIRTDKHVKLAAFEAGADDYITKPFDMDELEARIRAVLRRSAMQEADAPSGEIQVHDLVINLIKRRVVLNGDEVHLTPTEYELLRLLATHPGQVLTSHMLLDALRKDQKVEYDHLLRVHVNTLRKKLNDAPAAPRFIFTEQGVGYRFADVLTTQAL